MSFIDFCKKNSVICSLILCFVLPPVGIFLLFIDSFVSMYKKWEKQKNNLFSITSVFFLCLLVATIGASIELKNAIYFTTSLLIMGYLGLYLKISSNDSNVSFKEFRWVMIFGGIYSCLIGWISQKIVISPVVGLLTGTLLFGEPTPTNYGRLIGSAYNPNFNIFLLLLALAFLLAEVLSVLRKKSYLTVFWQLAAVMILTMGIFDTGSRSGFAAMLCLFMIFFIRLNKFSFIFVFILSIFQYKRLFKLMPRSEWVNNSMNTRIQVWENSLKLWEQHPIFGTTPFGFKQEFANLLQRTYSTVPSSLVNIPHAHDMYLGVFVEYGLVGGVAFLIFLGVNIWKSIPFFFKEKNQFMEHFLLALPVIILTGILDEPIFSPQIAILAIFLLSYWDHYTEKIFIFKPILSVVNSKFHLPLQEPKASTKYYGRFRMLDKPPAHTKMK